MTDVSLPIRPTAATEALIAKIREAEAELRAHNRKNQEECPHVIVFQQSVDGEVRICPVCGREEQTPYYHDFWFIGLKEGPNRLIVEPPKYQSIFKYRIPCSGRWVNGEYKG